MSNWPPSSFAVTRARARWPAPEAKVLPPCNIHPRGDRIIRKASRPSVFHTPNSKPR